MPSVSCSIDSQQQWQKKDSEQSTIHGQVNLPGKLLFSNVNTFINWFRLWYWLIRDKKRHQWTDSHNKQVLQIIFFWLNLTLVDCYGVDHFVRWCSVSRTIKNKFCVNICTLMSSVKEVKQQQVPFTLFLLQKNRPKNMRFDISSCLWYTVYTSLCSFTLPFFRQV